MSQGFRTERTAVIDLSQALIRRGLVVRTWGNISHRVDSEQPDASTGSDVSFVITPSGRTYDTMIEADLSLITAGTSAKGKRGKGRNGKVEMKKSGPFKPSSEYPMHALCYRLRPGARAVVHTHQRYASALSLLGHPVPLSDDEAARIGQASIPTSTYGLPGTKKLHRGVEHVLETNPDADVVLLAAHGVFLCGDTAEHALRLAERVEAAAKRVYQELTGSDLIDPDLPAPGEDAVRSEKVDGAVVYYDGAGGVVTPSAKVRARHEEVYAARGDVGAIRQCFDSEVQHFLGSELRPYLDDFAQIVGPMAGPEVGKTNVALGADAALCFGATDDDAAAAVSVLKKNARAARIAQVSGAHPIAHWECVLMNVVYRLKYSKQAG
nr:class II aldolase/adducin family protein [Corynebacterium lactis]